MTNKENVRSALILLIGLGALSGCGTTLPPAELVEARKVYAATEAGPAKSLAPAQLDTAKQALDKAEQSFEEEGDDQITKDLAYIADRRAKVAAADAGREEAERLRAQIDKDFKDQQLDALQNTKQQLASSKSAAEKTKAELEAEKRALEAEKKARAEAEKKAAAAMASLAEIAKVKEESRGIVITLSGAVLFATGQSALLPIARQKLDEVAKALTDQGFKKIVVEGHTDSRGSADKNQVLSLQRAESVRAYLVSKGIPSDKISATGLGSSRSVDSNDTAEGRANNRRVELVVEPLK